MFRNQKQLWSDIQIARAHKHSNDRKQSAKRLVEKKIGVIDFSGLAELQ